MVQVRGSAERKVQTKQTSQGSSLANSDETQHAQCTEERFRFIEDYNGAMKATGFQAYIWLNSAGEFRAAQ